MCVSQTEAKGSGGEVDTCQGPDRTWDGWGMVMEGMLCKRVPLGHSKDFDFSGDGKPLVFGVGRSVI